MKAEGLGESDIFPGVGLVMGGVEVTEGQMKVIQF